MTSIEIIRAIIKEQSGIIGDNLAIDRAKASGVVKFNSNNIYDFSLLIEDKSAILEVIKAYEQVFGAVSTQVCNNVLKKMEISL